MIPQKKNLENDRVPMTDDHKILHTVSVAATFTAEEETLFARLYQKLCQLNNTLVKQL